jgi:hypothetical protein
MEDVTIGKVLGSWEFNVGWMNPIKLTMVKPSPSISRNHHGLFIKELESMPHAALDLDALRVDINYHKAHIIITSFIGSKIIDGN